MKLLTYFVSTAVFLLTFYTGALADSHTTMVHPSGIVPFIKNTGQSLSEEQYYVESFAGRVSVGKNGITYHLTGNDQTPFAVHEHFVKNNVPASVDFKGVEQSPTMHNHLKGTDPEHWYANIPTYNSIGGNTPYDNILWTLSYENETVEKIFTVLPEGNANEINLHFSAGELSITPKGTLHLNLPSTFLEFTAPIAWQINNQGNKEFIPVSYHLKETGYGFQFPKGYDQDRTLWIDPVIAATYIGGDGGDAARDIAFDSNGNVILIGGTGSTTFPSTEGTTRSGDSDIYIQKWDPSLTTLLASTIIGGNDLDFAINVALDSNDNVYFAGGTDSPDYPYTTSTAFQGFSNTYEPMVTKISSDLSTIVASRIIRGYNASGTDYFRGMDVNPAGEVVAVGQNYSNGELTSPNYTIGPASGNVTYILKFNQDFSTYTHLRTSSSTPGDILYTSTGDIVLVTSTAISTYPVTTTRPYSGSSDILAARFSGDLSTLLAASYLPASSNGESVYDARLDNNDNVIIASFYSVDAYYLQKADINMERQWGLALGPYRETASAFPMSVSTDSNGTVYLGSTCNAVFDCNPNITDGSTVNGYSDAFIMTVNGTTGAVESYGVFGGTTPNSSSGREYITAVRIGPNDIPYFAGYVENTDFPVTDGSSFGGGSNDGILGTFTFSTTEVSVEQSNGAFDPTSVAAKYTVEFSTAIDPNTFTESDITVSNGEAVALTQVAPFDNTTFEFYVINASPGNITANISAGTISDANGVPVLASTSVDNSITYALTVEYTSPEETTDITAIVTEALIMTLDTLSINLTVDPSVNDGQDTSEQTTLTIASNAASGYTIKARLDDGSGNAQLISNTGNSISGNIAAGDNYLGYTARNNGTGSPTTAEQEFSATDSSILDANDDTIGLETTTDAQQHTVNYDLNVNFLTPAGVYTGSVYYTVIANF